MRASLPLSLTAGLLLSLLILSLALGGAFASSDPQAIDIAARLQSPGPHLLGTDQYGRDVLSLLIAGLSNSLLIAISAIALGALVGITVGIISAMTRFFWLDAVLSRAADVIFVFPALLIAVMMATLHGPSRLNAIIAIAVFNIPVFFRLARSLIFALLMQEFVRAARALGRGPLGLLFIHLLPGCAGMIAVQISIQLALALLAEAGLSYLGLGVPLGEPSLGRMLQEAQTYFTLYPRLALFPGGMITLAVLGFNLLGDGLRDFIDPRLRQGFC